MFDLNTIITQALNAAVAEAIKPLVERITALENNPAIGTDTVLAERVVALETKLNTAALFEKTTTVQTDFTPAQIVEAMNNAEWLWEKVNAYIETGIEDRIERAIDDHCSNYNHDDYDRHISDDSIHFEGDLDDAVREAVGNLSFEVSVS